MHYYEFHLGDDAAATSHLSLLEYAVLTRLNNKCFLLERPLPSDVKATQRLVGARTKREREAVNTMLEEFYVLEEDGWHYPHCDEVIARYQAGNIERQQRATNEKERSRRHREERAQLFAQLRQYSVTPAWNTSTPTLRDEIKRQEKAAADAEQKAVADTLTNTLTDAQQKAITDNDLSRTGNAPVTAIHKPILINQEPETKHPSTDSTRATDNRDNTSNSGNNNSGNNSNIDNSAKNIAGAREQSTMHDEDLSRHDDDLPRTRNAPVTDDGDDWWPDTDAQAMDDTTPAKQAPTHAYASTVCAALKAAGVPYVNPSHPGLLHLLEEDIDVQVFVEAGRIALSRKKGFTYVLGIVKNKLEQANTKPFTRYPPPPTREVDHSGDDTDNFF
ncbi:DUF1376 domain-containing protein [Neisseriaceae bacterium TC5R-5]|nr:DUF1376 domain-containing protein [Neisseriaceae bacterium TC5R-5]